MKYILTILLLISFMSCSPANQLKRAVNKVERYKNILGIKTCPCPEEEDSDYYDPVIKMNIKYPQ